MAANRACRNGFWAAGGVHMIAFQSWTASAAGPPGQIAARATRRTRVCCFLFGLMEIPPAVVSCGHTARTVLVSWHRVTTDRARKRYKDAKPVRKGPLGDRDHISVRKSDLLIRRLHARPGAGRPAQVRRGREVAAKVVRGTPPARRTAWSARDEGGAAGCRLGAHGRHRRLDRAVPDRRAPRDRGRIAADDQDGAPSRLHIRPSRHPVRRCAAGNLRIRVTERTPGKRLRRAPIYYRSSGAITAG